MRGISRSLLRLARWSIGWFPAALVLFLGLTYIYQLGLFMLAPGQPIWVTYEGQGGPAEIRAESYSVDPWTATARVHGVRWGKPGEAPQVTLDQGHLVWSGDAMQIDAGTVLARVTRRKGDKWSFQDLLMPQGEPAGEETPIKIRTDRLRLVYRDEMGAEAVGGIFDVDALDLERTQGQTTAAAMLRGGPFGRAELSLLARDDGYGWVRSDVRAADIVTAVKWAGPWLTPADRKPLAPFSGQQLLASGRADAAWAPGKAPQIRADLGLEGAGIAYAPYLRRAQVKGRVRLVDAEAQVLADVVEPGRSVLAHGVATWSQAPTWSGRVVAKVDNRNALWEDAARSLPRDMDFRGLAFDGWVQTDDQGLRLQGRASAGQVQVAGERVDGLEGQLASNGRQLGVNVKKARALGANWEAGLAYDLKTKRLSGAAKTPAIALAPLAARAGVAGLAGQVSSTVLIGGNEKAPELQIGLDGAARYRLEDGRTFDFDRLSARIFTTGDQFEIRRAEANLGTGKLLASGRGTFSKGGQAVVDAVGMSLDELLPEQDVEGQAYARAEVNWSGSDWSVEGRTEVFGLRAGDQIIPILGSEFSLDANRLIARDVRGLVQATPVRGNLALDLKTNELDGSVLSREFFVADWLPELNVKGTARLLATRIRGTLDDPVVEALVSLRDMGYGQFDSQAGSVNVRATKEGLDLREITLFIGQGVARGRGRYRWEDGDFDASAELDDITLAFRPEQAPEIPITGSVRGQLVAKGTRGQLSSAEANLRLADTLVGETGYGGGPLDVRFGNGQWTADGSIGTAERYLALRDVRYQQDTETGSGWVDVYGIEVEPIVDLTRARWIDSPEDVRRGLETLRGDVLGSFELTARGGALSTKAELFRAQNLSVYGRDAGEILLTARQEGEDYFVDSLVWDQGFAVRNARLGADDSLEGEVAIENFDLGWLATVRGELPLRGGRVNALFNMQGTLSQPFGEGRLAVTSPQFFQNGQLQTLDASLLLDRVRLTPNLYFADGELIAGKLKVQVGAEYPAFTAQFQEKPGEVRLTAKDVPLSDLGEFLDVTRYEANGTANLNLVVRDELGRWAPEGQLDVQAERLVVGDQALNKLNTVLAITADALTLTGSAFADRVATSPQPDLEFNATVGITDLLAGNADFDTWLNSGFVQGKIVARSFPVKGTIPTAPRPSSGEVSMDLAFSQYVGSPLVVGSFQAEKGVIVLPVEPLTGGAGVPPVINPQFAGVRLVVLNPARIEGPALTLDVNGVGTLNGSLIEPNLALPLTVSGGRLTLTSARINILPDGEIVLNYSGDRFAGGAARLDLNLQGRTSLAAPRDNGRYQVYRVNLDIQGDLLSTTERLRFVAESDPPDLSTDEILAIIGQGELISSLTSGGLTGTSLSRSLATALVPSLLDPVTSSLAQSLGLSFVFLDYNPFDGAFITIGKEIAPRLNATAFRQLSTPLDGQRQKFGLDLVYDVPSRIRRVQVSFGLTQDLPWRLRIDWSRRI